MVHFGLGSTDSAVLFPYSLSHAEWRTHVASHWCLANGNSGWNSLMGL